jgi:hypothetical protein
MRQSVRGVRNLDGMPDGHSASVRQCVRGRTAPVPHGQLGGHGGRTPTMLTLLEAAVACGSSGLGRARLRAARVAMSRWLPQDHPSPRWWPRAVGGRTAVRVSDRRRHRHGQRHQPVHVCRTPPSGGRSFRKQRTVKSADRSDSLSTFPSRLALRAVCAGGLSNARRAEARNGPSSGEVLGWQVGGIG